MASLYRGADGLNCKDIINGIAFSMPFCCILLDTAIFLVKLYSSAVPDMILSVFRSMYIGHLCCWERRGGSARERVLV